MVDTVITALTSVEFGAGFRLGFIAAVLGTIGVVLWRRNPRQAGHVVGVLFAAAVTISMETAMPVPAQLLLGLGLLGLTALIPRTALQSRASRMLAAVPGAWLIVGSLGTVYSTWISWLLLAVIVVGGTFTAHTDQKLSAPILGPLLLAVTAIGVFLAVPDTEEILVVVGAIVPLAVLGWPLGISKLGSSGSYMAVGILVWASAWGGVGRPAAIVGAVSCLGVFLLIPVSPHRDVLFSWDSYGALLVGLHLGLVAVASRLSGQQSDPRLAVVYAAAALGGGYIITQLATTRPHREHRDSGEALGHL